MRAKERAANAALSKFQKNIRPHGGLLHDDKAFALTGDIAYIQRHDFIAGKQRFSPPAPIPGDISGLGCHVGRNKQIHFRKNPAEGWVFCFGEQ
jgi:hypothetical protein